MRSNKNRLHIRGQKGGDVRESFEIVFVDRQKARDVVDVHRRDITHIVTVLA